MNAEVAIALFNILLLGSIGVIHWTSVKYGAEYTKLPEFARKLNALLFIWVIVTDLAYLLNSKVFVLLSLSFLIVLLVFVFKRSDVLRNNLEVNSRKPCRDITVKTLLGRESHPCLIELARRTSVNFAITVWYLLNVIITIPVYFVLLYAFSWKEGFIYYVSSIEILGYSLLIAVPVFFPIAYLMRRELIKIRAKELSEPQLR